ncbi:MAG: PfkB family carbohydrate kinase [bacterium]|nr:PfkB family carbohydrate kinase [bacterium]
MDQKRFESLLERFHSKRVAVVGDFILDEYLIGDTRRVSREAPVIVIDYRESVYHPGGAANATQNVASLSGSARAFGMVGGDKNGKVLADILKKRGVDPSGLVTVNEISTAVKTRILAGELHAQRQQVARIDRSYRVESGVESLHLLADRVAAACEDSDAVLIADYGMGVVPGEVSLAAIEACRNAGTPVIIDSRFQLTHFNGATVAVPNEVELFDALKSRDRSAKRLGELAHEVIQKQQMDGLIVTRGSRGMLVFEKDTEPEPVGIVGSRDVTDVTGAGDTVAAAVALTLGSGGTLSEAAEIATYAAAVVVMKRGTATVTRNEMLKQREEWSTPKTVKKDLA